MSYRDQVVARFGLRVVVPAVAVLVGALVIVIISLSEMSDEVNRIEDRLTERSAEAAVRVTIRKLEETHRDYAEWDDAARNVYGEVNEAFMAENFTSSTIDAGLLRHGHSRRRGRGASGSPSTTASPSMTRPSEIYGAIPRRS